ncbi:GTP-binding protein Rheb isoform X1 [Amphiprion ocellaris]|uniref:GTP-binding protein Rheb isoform X1 n=1 Tax=Amphiprion ocellaris TaxID=80972 RepID=UPI0024116264|nr:GTP-binding protein Rheb isoform X1 [Amphiprion ocellaris]
MLRALVWMPQITPCRCQNPGKSLCWATGKSSLTIQFVEGQFVDSYDPTIENTFTKTMTVNGQDYNLQLVDTAGQDEYSIFPQSYTIDVDGYILIYSVTSYKSFEVVRVIHEKLLDMVGNVQVPIILVGNKKDLHMERVISFEEGKALAESWNAAFLESSAKENQVREEMRRQNPKLLNSAVYVMLFKLVISS